MQMKTKFFLLSIWHIWITLCHHLVFLQIKFFSLSLSQTRSFVQIVRHSKSEICQVPKTPPFPVVKIPPHKRPIFAIRVFWTNNKLNYFQNSQVVG
jgi:hypothetical protein